ncbi:MAG: thioredoxin family protein [Saprospiraceae bacterium]
MTRFFLFLILCGTAFQACSQAAPTTPEKPKATTSTTIPTTNTTVYASTKAGWLVDLDEAYEISVKEKKPILANFTGSDWCGWCKKLDADVFSKPEFQEWAKKNVVLLELDFPRRFQIPEKNRRQNAAMGQALGITGYPTIWVLNLTKDEVKGQFQVKGLGKTGYTPTPGQFIASLQQYVGK